LDCAGAVIVSAAEAHKSPFLIASAFWNLKRAIFSQQ
jgi:hypothetical protein